MVKTKVGSSKVFTVELDSIELSRLELGLEIMMKNDLDILEGFNQRKPRPLDGIRACVYTLHENLQLYNKLEAIHCPDEEDRTDYMQMHRMFKKQHRIQERKERQKQRQEYALRAAEQEELDNLLEGVKLVW